MHRGFPLRRVLITDSARACVPQGKMGGNWSSQENDYSSDSSFSPEEETPMNNTNPTQNKGENNKYYQQNQPSYGSYDNICLDSAGDTVDAIAPTTTMSIMLELDQVMLIEEQLDQYEKVSLVYLLYDNPKTALEDLLKLVSGAKDKLIYNWSIHQNLAGHKWNEKLIEALCIIQNYQVLRNLGFKQNVLKDIFLPHHSFTFVHVNKIRKALYFICENFIQKDVEQMLDFVCPDFRNSQRFNFKVYNPQYLELYFLYWEEIGYIKQDDLSNLCKILKRMDQLDLCDKLKDLIPAVTPNTSGFSQHKIGRSMSKTVDASEIKKSESVFAGILDPNFSLKEFASPESPISADNAAYVSSDNKYDIDPNNPGICLIINQEIFYREIEKNLQELLPPPETKLVSRQGTEHDKEKLEASFKTFGFKTIVKNNLIHSDVIKVIEEVIEDVRDESSVFVCIMSHGDQGVIYGANSCRVKVEKIKNIMSRKNRTHLSGKPKVLILQSCQGTTCQKITDEEDDDIVTDGPNSPPREVVPPKADLFTFWATVPGYGAIRNKRTGSWFIQSLCDKMKELGNQYHFEDICTAVIGDVSGKTWCQWNKEEVAMVPLKDSTLRKLLYLPPIKI